MATTAFTVDDTAYTEITTGDGLVQNKSAWPMYIHFGVAPPAADTNDYHVLTQYATIEKAAGSPAGNIYARGGRKNQSNQGVLSN